MTFQALFDGTLADWSVEHSEHDNFRLEDGVLRVEEPEGWLRHHDQFADFELEVEFRFLTEDADSGIFFRCIPGEKMNGYESQIHNGFKSGDRTQPVDCGTGGIFRRQDARRIVAERK